MLNLISLQLHRAVCTRVKNLECLDLLARMSSIALFMDSFTYHSGCEYLIDLLSLFHSSTYKLKIHQMGCISSKDITRSMSIREELNHGFNTTSAAWEELLTSHSGNDHLFALVRSANSMGVKLRTNSFTLPSTHLEASPQAKSLANSRQLIQEIRDKTEAESADAVGEREYGRYTRSKSCQVIGSREMLGQDPENDEMNENKLDSNDKNLRGSRSFHTVEEYDALMERIHNFTTRNIEPFEDHYPRESKCLDENKNEGIIQTSTEDSMKKEQDLNLDSSSLRNSDASANDEQGDGMLETGWKRKAIAKGLKSLDISAVEFPSVARFRQRIHVEGQVYSPGTYVTPKFGSYNVKVTSRARENEVQDDEVFSPELVAAFEDCMKQLQIEEERILCAMDQRYSTVADEIEI